MEASLVIWILFVFYLLESVAEDLEYCRKIDDCTCLKNNGKIISLRKLDGGCKGPAFRNIKDSDPERPMVYDWNPCTKFTEDDDCKDVLMCQVYGTSLFNPLAITVSDFAIYPDGTTHLSYQEVRYWNGSRFVDITLKCDESKFPGEISNVTLQSVPPARTANCFATLTSKCACDDGCIPDDGNF